MRRTHADAGTRELPEFCKSPSWEEVRQKLRVELVIRVPHRQLAQDPLFTLSCSIKTPDWSLDKVNNNGKGSRNFQKHLTQPAAGLA